MKVTARKELPPPPPFMPITLTIIVESREESHALMGVLLSNITVPRTVKANFPMFTNEKDVQALLDGIREQFAKAGGSFLAQ